LKYRNNRDYMSLYSLVKTGDLFGADFCYKKLPEELDVFDYDTFKNNPTRMYVCCTNVETGEPEYLECKDMKYDMEKLRASASLPLVARIVETDGKKLLDGGISDSIPICAFRRMGYRKNIVVLTRPEGYRKEPDKMIKIEAIKYKEYPEFVKREYMRHVYYNKTLDKLAELEAAGEVYVIRPSRTMDISRVEKDEKKIQAMYDLGVADCRQQLEKIQEFLLTE
jgi:predicted patatin/cPLA2 family phospholipase